MKTPAELHHAGFIYYNLHDARNHENQIPEWTVYFAVRTDVFKCKFARFAKVFVSLIIALLSAVPGFY